jgi:hypothetical protein
VTLNPIAIIITRARKADQLPARHVTVAAVDRIGKKAFLCVAQQQRKKVGALDVLQCDRARLKPLEHGVLFGRREIAKGFSGEIALDVIRQRFQACAIARRRSVRELIALRRGCGHEGRPRIKALGPPIGACELPVDEHGASGVFATGAATIRRDQAINRGLDQRGLIRGEKHPGTRTNQSGRRRHPWLPRQAAGKGAGACQGRPNENKCGSRSQQQAPGWLRGSDTSHGHPLVLQISTSNRTRR